VSKVNLGKQRTVCGAYSPDDKECSTGVGLDRDSYNPGRKPNVCVSNAKGLNKIDLSKQLDGNFYDSIGEEGDGLKGGYSGPVSRSRQK
jgi:hypothetical protein